MKEIIRAFKKATTTFDPEAFYLFMVDKSSTGNAGYMPRKHRYGFIYMGTAGDKPQTIAHELGHGAFRLQHTFEEHPTIAETTQNLMDYGSGTTLRKYQWDLIHNPPLVIGLVEDLGEGALAVEDEESELDGEGLSGEEYLRIVVEDEDHIGGVEMANEVVSHLYETDNSTQTAANSTKRFKVTIRSFLPYLFVLDPLNNPITGRDRIDLANVRDYPQYQNVEEHGGYKTEQTFTFDFSQNLVLYNTEENYIVPSTYLLDRNTNEAQRIVNDESNDILTNIQENNASTKGINGSVRYLNFLAAISAGNPAVDPSPNIDYTLGFGIREDGQYKVYGIWDGFPALEIFIEDIGTGQIDLVYLRSTSDARQNFKPKDIFDLIDKRGDVSIDITSTLDNDYTESRKPYNDVENMYQLFNVER